MLEPGKELYIKDKPVLCLKCNWEGAGVELSTGLVRKHDMFAFLYVYACPACGSFELTRKGKLLSFPSQEEERKRA